MSKQNKEIAFIKTELRKSLYDFQERGLINGAKWASEQLISMVSTPEEKIQKENIKIDQEVEDLYSFAKSLFDLKEYARCSFTLEKVKEKSTVQEKKCLFLKLY